MLSFFTNLRKYFREYCTNTSVHGFHYFGEKRTIFERFWWSSALLISLSLCSYCIYTVYGKWEQSPITTTLANTDTLIYDIPFPAVTICPMTKSDREKFNYTEMYKRSERNNLSQTEQLHFEYMTMICSDKDEDSPIFSQNFGPKLFSQEFYNYIDQVKPKFLPDRCRTYFYTPLLECFQLFRPILTEEGICYSFNLLDRNEMFRENVFHYNNYQQYEYDSSSPYWSIDYGYKNFLNVETYPFRALYEGVEGGLKLSIITNKSDLDALCSFRSGEGYKVLLHSPASFPRPSQNYFMLPLDKSVVAAVLPSMTTTSESLWSYSKDKRKCYFQTERHLRFFKIYNRENCELECLVNHTLKHCGCAGFFMPRDNETEICGTKRISCLQEASKSLRMERLRNELMKKMKNTKSEVSPRLCDCLQLCTDLNYDAEVSQNVLNFKKKLTARYKESIPVVESIYFSSLTIYFKTNTFTRFERHEFYGPVDFLANFGGLLGLFTGISVLSVIEILYFLSVRILCNKWLYGRWVGQDAQN